MMLKTDDIEQLEQRYRALFINSLSGFKSANLVGTCDAQQHTNLAIVSSVTHLGAAPPLLSMIMRPHSVDRHTLENLMTSGYYTLNHVHREIFTQAHQTSARYPREVSEFDATGLTPLWQDDFPAPFVQESRIRLGMKLREQHTLAVNGVEMVIGEIVMIDVPDALVSDDGYIALETAGTVAVSSLDGYHTTQRLDRLSYAKPTCAPAPVPKAQ